MKQVYYFLFAIVLSVSPVFSFGSVTMEDDSVSLGAGYANDVYYSFENGEILSVERQNWDIGFYTSPWSAGIITNGGNGVELYLYPGDTSSWSSIDTAGLSTWPVLYNSTEEWEDGAFNRNALGHPDYGWGIYNTVTHDVVGDSMYLIKFVDGGLKKLWIEKKVSMQNIYYFKYADIDGENEVSEILLCNDYTDKNFVYYSMKTQEILDREPEKHSWDILFTKYMGEYAPGVPYPVTGVLNNIDIPANKFEQIAPEFEDWTAAPMDSTKSPIGWDWKYFDMGTFSYIVEDSLAYFVRNKDQHVFKLVFSVFDYTVGNVVFAKSMVYTSGLINSTNVSDFSIYPNPANENVNIEIGSDKEWTNVSISDVTGKMVYSEDVTPGKRTVISVNGFTNGLYFVTLKSSTNYQVQKLIIKNN